MTFARSSLSALLVESVLGRSGPLPDGADTVPPEALVAAANAHRVTPAVRRRVDAAPDSPPVWKPILDAMRHRQLMVHMAAMSDLGAVSDAFAAAGIRWAVAKGPVLADALWPEPDMREYSDLDVFVHPSDLSIALHELDRAGFALVDRNWPELARSGRAEVALRGRTGLGLDLHWNIVVSPRSRRAFPISLAEMLDRSRRVRFGTGLEAATFDPTDSLLHVTFHASQSGANRLVWLGDVHYAAMADVDWDAFAWRARAARMTPAVAMVLARAERVLGTRYPLPDDVRAAAERTLWARWAARDDRARLFPWLPGDTATSGRLYESARRSVQASVLAALRSSIEVRVTEARVRRDGRDHNPLDDDVPDDTAKAEYLAAAATDGT